MVAKVGGVKDKVLAAHADKLQRVILPSSSRHQLKDVPQYILVGDYASCDFCYEAISNGCFNFSE